MSSKKKRYPKVVAPAGVSGFSHIHKADTEGKYANNKFKIQVRYDEAEVDLSKIEAACHATAKEEWGKVPADLKLPYAPSDKKEDDGVVILRASSKFAPGVVDAKRNDLEDGVQVYAGDLVKFSATTYPYSKTEDVVVVVDGKKKRQKETVYGISLQLRGVQLLEKRGGGSGDVSDDFEDEDDYAAPSRKAKADDFDGGDDDVDDF